MVVATSAATADEIHFAIDNNAWDGNANLGVYAPASGAVIDYEIFVSITDAELDGYDAQGLAGFDGDLITNTGITQPLLDYSPTNEGTPYIYTVVDPHWIGDGHLGFVAGFGMGFINSHGNNSAEQGNVVGAGAFMNLDWRHGSSRPSFTTSNGQPGIGLGSPADGPFPFFNSYGANRTKWYLLRGQTNVPDAPGAYMVDFSPTTLRTIRTDVDLNNDIFDGYVEDGFADNQVTSSGFSFTVTPEPATASLLLAGLAGLVFNRRRSI